MNAPMQVGPYQLVQPLGLGGQASVWLATDTRNGASVAIKMLPPGSSATDVARLRRESDLLLSFSDPGLPRGICTVEDDARRMWGFVMEYVQGIPISRIVKERAIDAQSVAWFALELARIVAVLHSRGVIHRDVKPANVLVRDGWERGVQGSIVLVDLGIAKGTAAHATACTAPGKLVGSAPYIAPELLFTVADAAPTTAVDVFSIGVMIWFLLFRKHPTGLPMSSEFFDFLEAYRSGALVVPDSGLADEIQDRMPGMIPVLYRCLEFSLERRYPHAGELHQALLRVLSRLATGKSEPPPGFAAPAGVAPGAAGTPAPPRTLPDYETTLDDGASLPKPFGYEITRDDPAKPSAVPAPVAVSRHDGTAMVTGLPDSLPGAPAPTQPDDAAATPPESRALPLALILGLVVLTVVIIGGASAAITYWIAR